MDSKKRSIVKSLIWRITGIVILMVIAYSVTEDLKVVSLITILFHSIRVVLYYFHERMWNKISWGKTLDV